MAENADIPPTWKKPADLMKVRLKSKRRNSSARSNSPALEIFSNRSTKLPSGDDPSGKKRRNPFGSQDSCPPRRLSCRVNHVSPAGDQDTEWGTTTVDAGTDIQAEHLVKMLDFDENQAVFAEDSKDAAPQGRSLATDKSDISKKETDDTTDEQDNDVPVSGRTSPILPLDWTIKSRVRFNSSFPFRWSLPLKTSEEAQGLCAFVRDQEVTMDGGEDTTQDDAAKHSGWKSCLQRALMVWSHPHLPWLKLFPRITHRPKITSTSFAANNENIQRELMASWGESFRSAFYLTRSRHCAYFYLLAHQFTVLFMKDGVGGCRGMQALLTPTTKGLREAMKEEGIDFTLPLAKLDEQTSPSSRTDGDECVTSPNGANEETGVAHNTAEENSHQSISDDEEFISGAEQDAMISQDDGAACWLQSMGLDRGSFPTLEPSKVNFQRDSLMRVDNRPQSTVLIQGADTQALFNYLLNAKAIVAPIGSMTGIPPTILAPVAFQGATLDSYTWRPNVMKKAIGNTLHESYSLEITGPLLPHNIFNVCQLLRRTQNGCFSGTFNNHEPTAPFSLVGENTASVIEGDCLELGLSDFLVPQDGTKFSAGIVKEFNCQDGLYEWL